MSQPEMTKQTEPPYTPTQTEAALEEFRKAGVPIERTSRLFISKKMTGFNADVYSGWIQRWAVNAATNYPVVKGAAGVAFLKNAAKEIPAVVVGIGPSLDRCIQDLKRAPRHAVIIATDAALRPLARHGIHPDLVVNFDARDEQRTMWESLDTSRYVLLANSATSPYTIDAWKGSILFFNMRQDDDEFCTNILPAINPYLGQIPNMGTVGNGAIWLAHFMGCKPIITVGMDLCYKEDIETTDPGRPNPWRYRCKDWRSNGSVPEYPDGWWIEEENKVLYDNDERMAKTMDEVIKGKTYKVDEMLKFYRNSLISNIGQYDFPIINCSGGVLTDLVKSMPFRDALETKCYTALEPARTTLKYLKKLIPAPNHDWTLVPDARIFIPSAEGLWPRRTQNEVSK